MKTDLLRHPYRLSLPILLSLALACSGPNALDTDPGPTPPDRGGPGEFAEEVPELEPKPPWPETFRSPALLIADEILIEGPKGLLDHVATRIEPDHHTYEAETLPEGFRQAFEPRRKGTGVEIRAYLDATELVALERLILLERPGQVDVVVSARGDVYFRDTETGAERRGPTLILRGE